MGVQSAGADVFEVLEFIFLLLFWQGVYNRAFYLNHLCRMTFQWNTAGCIINCMGDRGMEAGGRPPYIKDRLNFLFDSSNKHGN